MADDDISIHPINGHLLDQLLAINAAAFPETWGERWSGKDISNALALDSVDARLAVRQTKLGDSVQGFLLSRTVADEAEVLLLGVPEVLRRRGIARRLLSDFVSRCEQHRIRHIFLEVRENNIAALRLYQNAGFRQMGRRDNYYKVTDGRKLAALTLSLHIPAEIIS